MKVLVLNAGSSSIKYELFEMTDRSVLASGLLERIGERESQLTHHHRGDDGAVTKVERKGPVADHREGFAWIGAALNESGAVRESSELYGVGSDCLKGLGRLSTPRPPDRSKLAASIMPSRDIPTVTVPFNGKAKARSGPSS